MGAGSREARRANLGKCTEGPWPRSPAPGSRGQWAQAGGRFRDRLQGPLGLLHGSACQVPPPQCPRAPSELPHLLLPFPGERGLRTSRLRPWSISLRPGETRGDSKGREDASRGSDPHVQADRQADGCLPLVLRLLAFSVTQGLTSTQNSLWFRRRSMPASFGCPAWGQDPEGTAVAPWHPRDLRYYPAF